MECGRKRGRWGGGRGRGWGGEGGGDERREEKRGGRMIWAELPELRAKEKDMMGR